MRNSLVQSKHRGLIGWPTGCSHSNCWDALCLYHLVYNVARLCYRHQYVANLKWVFFNPVLSNQYLRCFTYIDDLKEQSLKKFKEISNIKKSAFRNSLFCSEFKNIRDIHLEIYVYNK